MELAEAIFMNLIVTFSQAFLTDVEPLTNFGPEIEYVQEMHCLALNTYHETRGEDFESKVAVAQSVMNRVHDEEGEFRRYGSTCSVIQRAHLDNNGEPIKHKCWYSWFCDGLPDHVRMYKDGVVDILEKQAWKDSILASFYAYHDLYEPLVGGSTHYYNFTTANPAWAEHYRFIADVGPHRFLK